jgi:hypothetical protein
LPPAAWVGKLTVLLAPPPPQPTTTRARPTHPTASSLLIQCPRSTYSASVRRSATPGASPWRDSAAPKPRGLQTRPQTVPMNTLEVLPPSLKIATVHLRGLAPTKSLIGTTPRVFDLKYPLIAFQLLGHFPVL